MFLAPNAPTPQPPRLIEQWQQERYVPQRPAAAHGEADEQTVEKKKRTAITAEERAEFRE